MQCRNEVDESLSRSYDEYDEYFCIGTKIKVKWSRGAWKQWLARSLVLCTRARGTY